MCVCVLLLLFFDVFKTQGIMCCDCSHVKKNHGPDRICCLQNSVRNSRVERAISSMVRKMTVAT